MAMFTLLGDVLAGRYDCRNRTLITGAATIQTQVLPDRHAPSPGPGLYATFQAATWGLPPQSI